MRGFSLFLHVLPHSLYAPLTGYLTDYLLGRAPMTKRRRTKGSGSIYVRKDGRVVGQYEVNGKQRYIYGASKQKVAAKLAKAIADRDNGLVYDSEKLSTAQHLDNWLQATRDTVRIGTWKQYETIVRLHIKPTLGRIRLNKLNPLQVQTLYRERLDAGLSARRVRYVHVTIHKALKDAVRWQLIPRNVADAVAPPRPSNPEINPLNAQQTKTLLTAAEGDRLYALYVLAVTTGMRIGEMFGLKWSDVDLGRGTLQVRRTVAADGAINPPKTARSRRTIRLTKLAIRALRQHEQKAEWVFASAAGTPIGICNFHKNSWKPLLKRAGLPHKRAHDLRHTAATLMLSRGVPVKVVSEMLGHANVSTTLSIYLTFSRQCRTMRRESWTTFWEVSDALGAVLSGSVGAGNVSPIVPCSMFAPRRCSACRALVQNGYASVNVR
jgi:integrase